MLAATGCGRSTTIFPRTVDAGDIYAIRIADQGRSLGGESDILATRQARSAPTRAGAA